MFCRQVYIFTRASHTSWALCYLLGHIVLKSAALKMHKAPVSAGEVGVVELKLRHSGEGEEAGLLETGG